MRNWDCLALRIPGFRGTRLPAKGLSCRKRIRFRVFYGAEAGTINGSYEKADFSPIRIF